MESLIVELFRCKYNKLHLNCMNPFGELCLFFRPGPFRGGFARGSGLRGRILPESDFLIPLFPLPCSLVSGRFQRMCDLRRSPLRTTCAFPPRNGFTAAQPGQLRRVRPAVSM